MAYARINRELQNLRKNPPANCSAGPIGKNIYKWSGTIMAPNGSPYEGGVFRVSIKFPSDYPNSPPQIKFTTKVYHPNISRGDGTICLDILESSGWRPDITVSKMLLSISALLCDPNPDDPLEWEIAELFKTDKKRFKRKAARYTEKYAMEL